ncbi:MAG: hypothetical protein PHC61_13920 [Chitinivibrionales bacterium]|nr:hypothetical protein [Chitinivibrionales bacterium]
MSASTETITLQEEKQKLPNGWRWATLGEVCKKQISIRDPSMEPDITFQYVDITSVNNTQKSITEARQILGKDAPSRARKVVHTI